MADTGLGHGLDDPVPAEAATPQEESATHSVFAETAEEAAYRIDPPPSAELAYDVEALREGQKWHGKGVFNWQASSGRYSVSAEVSVTFLFVNVTALNSRSEGIINGFGIAPVLYSEKPRGKSTVNTHFQHEQKKISFSASEAVYPYLGGEQDRATIMWQIAAIGRGNPERFSPGAGLDIVVAGTRKAENWHIQIVGQEEIETELGPTLAWHVMRVPGKDSHERRIDFWLAPEHDWYPVKVRFTHANGDYYDLSLSSLNKAAAQ
jgi:hypothetical protein